MSTRVALVHDFIHTFGGAERVLLAMHEMYPDAPIYTTRYDSKLTAKYFPNAVFVASSLQHSSLGRRPELLLPKYPAAVEEWNFSEFDLVISSSGAFSHGIITGPDTVHICYCHTPMRYAWDWHAENIAERGMDGTTRGVLLQRMMSKLRLWDAVSAKRVDFWIANSKTVQERIGKYYRTESTVMYPPVDTSAAKPQGERDTYAVSISRLTANKHIDQIISACHAAGIPLKIAGTGKELPKLQALAKKLGADVTFLGAVTEGQKFELLGTSRCFVFAAEDDFGIAAVEALASGMPVIGFDKGGLQETVQNTKTGILYPELTAESLAEALTAFLREGVSASSQEIAASAERFSISHFKETLSAYVDSHVR